MIKLAIKGDLITRATDKVIEVDSTSLDGKLIGRVVYSVVEIANRLWFITDVLSKHKDHIISAGDYLQIVVEPVTHGNCPNDGRMNRPIYILLDGVRTLAVADGKGDAYKVYGEGYDQYKSICKPENKYSLDSYEFDRGLSGFDF